MNLPNEDDEVIISGLASAPIEKEYKDLRGVVRRVIRSWDKEPCIRIIPFDRDGSIIFPFWQVTKLELIK